MRFGKEKMSLVAEALAYFGVVEPADIRIPEYSVGDAIYAKPGEIGVILSVNVKGQFGIEYTILYDGEAMEHVSENALSGWNKLVE